MTKARGRARIDSGLADMSAEIEFVDVRPEEFHDPDVEKHHVDNNPIIWIDGLFEYQIWENTTRVADGQPKAGMLLNFATGFDKKMLDDLVDIWIPVVRIDCAHGYVHVDRLEDGIPHDVSEVPDDIASELDLGLKWAKVWLARYADDYLETE